MRTDELRQVADAADFIVDGYAFTSAQGQMVRVLNLGSPSSAAVLSRDGEVLETTMDDIELAIVTEILAKNRMFLELTYA